MSLLEWLFQQVVGVMMDEAVVFGVDADGTIRHMRTSDRFAFPIEIGMTIQDAVLAQSVTAKAWQSRERIVSEGDPNLFGFDYVSVAQPVFTEDGTFAGVVSVIYAASNKKVLEDGMVEMKHQMETLEGLSRELADAGMNIAQTSDVIAQASTEISRESEALKSINELIGEVARQTNLLGLNAAIEAARAGDEGRGFSVVADEIRKLAQTVKGSAQEISGRIDALRAQAHNIAERTQETMANSEEQAAQLEELSATVTQLHETVTELMNRAL